MFRCLVASGLDPGPSNSLLGRDYKSENKLLARLIRNIIHARARKTRVTKGYIRVALQQRINTLNYEVVKNPYTAFAIEELCKYNENIRTAKYIWTRRDLRETTESFIRKQEKFGRLYNEPERTFKETMGYIRKIDRIWQKFLPGVDHIEVWLDDLINETEKTKTKVSEFIGREFNIDLVSKAETWAESGEVRA